MERVCVHRIGTAFARGRRYIPVMKGPLLPSGKLRKNILSSFVNWGCASISNPVKMGTSFRDGPSQQKLKDIRVT